ncbi:MAG: amino acid permease [Candidatus Lokiarchaeota archaeon]|nr:amino acid permease [Candidatus Lokiarchaeota archaeon]MBD3199136.1 amino acid permease [Candidatus Lokiarchaeota archaeon]
MEDQELKRGLNLPMAIFVIIGIVIGSSIWISPAAYLNETGPSVFIAYIIAVIPAVFIAFICAYLGSAVPIAGGTYVLNSRMSGKFVGFITAWMVILAVGAALAFLASAFGLFLSEIFLIPDELVLLFVIIMGILVLVGFYGLNLLNIEISGIVEIIITIIGDILVMLIFIFAAIPYIDATNFDPLFPPELGITPLLMASLTFFFSYVGFNAVLEIAGEVKNPKRTIPISLLISIPILMILYTIQALVVAGIQPWNEEVETVTEIIINKGIFPFGAVIFITILIAIAIASTIHPTFLAYSRDILMASRDEILPKNLAKVSKKNKTPSNSLSLLLIVGIIFLIIFIPILGPMVGIGTAGVLLSAITAVATLILQIPICISAIILPKRFPELHEESGFKPPTRLLKVMGIGGALISFIFVLLLFTDTDAGLLIALIVFPYLFIGIIVYFFRNRSLKKRGINIKATLQKFPEEVRVEKKMPGKVKRLSKEIDHKK